MQPNQRRRGLYSIGEAAKAAGLTIKALRHYEEVGLIPKPRRHDGAARTGGDRLYTETELVRLRFIRQARHLDLSLGEIRGLVAISEERCPSSHPDYQRILAEHLETVGQRIAQLNDLHTRLATLLSKTGEAPGCSDDTCGCLDAGSPPSVRSDGDTEGQPAEAATFRRRSAEHTYACPNCGCAFTRAESEPAICKCPGCEREIDTDRQGCVCCA